MIPPGPTNHWFIGNMLRTQRTPLTFFTELTEQYGGLVHFRAGFQSIYLATYPTYIEHILRNRQIYTKETFTYKMLGAMLGEGLLTSEGELWRCQRRSAQKCH